MKTSNKTTRTSLAAAILAVSVAATMFVEGAIQRNAKLWEPISERALDQAARRLIVPLAYRTVRLDKKALAQLLVSAPMEFSRQVSENPVIELPMPDGRMARFHFEESPVMEASFGAAYPELKTYRAQGIDDPAATSRFDWLPSGFHAIILAPAGTVLIDPYAEGNKIDYISYWKKDATNTTPFVCGFKDSEPAVRSNGGGIAPAISSGATLRTYRLAIACTNEFAVAVGGNTVAGTIAKEVTIMNRVNSVFERDVTIHMNMVNNAAITYAGDNNSCGGPCNASNDPFTNEGMIGQMASVLRSVIGAANYDMGHGFFFGSGGGTSGLVCNSDNKEIAVSGLGSVNEGDSFGVVSHEMGHQFTATHTFNANGPLTNSCSGNRANDSAYEVGGGVTIEGYGGGTCGNQSMGPPTDTFHVKSIEQMIAYTQTGGGSLCPVLTATGNTPPVVTGPGNFTIPKQTPFSLTAYAPERGITYEWEEYDLDAGGMGTEAVPNTDSDGTPRPILRGYPPTTGGTRIFPALQYILKNANVPPNCDPMPCTPFGPLTGELLPAISRTMVFQVVVRNGGGISTAQSAVTIDGDALPFAVTSPNTAITIEPPANFNVTWVPSGNAAYVKISLSTDGGKSFPTVLAAIRPNDGAELVVIPNMPTEMARIKVEAVLGNIYFDISDTNFIIKSPKS